jgi:sensor domain CHASE-containing protein
MLKVVEAKKLNQNDFEEHASDKLAILGSVISTIGDFISTIAAVMALDESILDDAQQQQDQKEQEEKFQKMQKQIDDLKNELSKMKS